MSPKIGTGLLSALGVVLAAATASTAEAQVAFRKVADTGTTIPGGADTFDNFATPAIDGGQVVFSGASATRAGVYLESAGASDLLIVADSTTTMPGGGGAFASFGGASIDGDAIVFTGFDGVTNGLSGVYLDDGGALTTVADSTTAAPVVGGTFATFIDLPQISGTNVAFRAKYAGASSQGVFARVGGTLEAIATESTPVPDGSGNFRLFGRPDIEGARVALFGGVISPSQAGVYEDNGGGLVTVADKSTAVPGGSGNFRIFRNPIVADGEVLFLAFGSPGFGVYASGDGGDRKVVDSTDLAPLQAGLDGIGFGLCADDDAVAFTAYEFNLDIENTLFTNVDGTLRKVTGFGELLDGRQVLDVTIGPDCLDNGQIAFRVLFEDDTRGFVGSQAIYVASIVESIFDDGFESGSVTE